MCYDQKTSLLAFIAAWTISLYLIYRNRNFDRWNAAFIMTFSTIQFLEFGVWGSIYTNDIRINRTLTVLIIIALTLQPLVQSLNIPNSDSPKKLLVFVYAAILGYTAYRVYNVDDGSNPKGGIYTTVGPTNHLVWNAPGGIFGGWLIDALYMIGLFLPLIYQGFHGLPIFIVGMATLFYSIYNSTSGEVGSLWCISSISLAFVALLI